MLIIKYKKYPSKRIVLEKVLEKVLEEIKGISLVDRVVVPGFPSAKSPKKFRFHILDVPFMSETFIVAEKIKKKRGKIYRRLYGGV